MKSKLFFALLLCGAAQIPLSAQLRYGFKTGLNFAHINGPSETDAAGAALESWKNVTGFHIGMTLAHPFTKNFGLRAEVLYSKKGGKYTFDAAAPDASYKIFKTGSGDVFTTSKTARYLINTANSYIDIPLMAYGRWGSFEVSAGVGLGLLVGSSGDGSAVYSGYTVTSNGNANLNQPTGELKFNLKYNYNRDDPGGFTEATEKVAATLGNQTIELPKTLGAYFDNATDLGNLYNTLDYNALFGLTYYMSSALYANVRLQYGLADITNNKADVSRTKVDEQKKPTLRDDKDTNFVISASVGFSF